MPIGPSHSGRSSSRSSSSGRSFSSGRSYSSGSRSSSSGRNVSSSGGSFHHGPIRFVFFGRSVVLTPLFQFLISVCLILCFVFGFLCYTTHTNLTFAKDDAKYYSRQLDIFESDNIEFTELINNSQNNINGYYKTTATFDDSIIHYEYSSNPQTPGIYYAFDRLGIQWHFIVYKYYNEAIKQFEIGTTYTQFSAGQSNALNGEIDISYSKLGDEWWSMNNSFNLQTNQDYLLAKDYYNLAKSEQTRHTLMFILFILLTIGSVGLIVLIVIKKSQKTKKEEQMKQEKEDAEIREAQAKASVAEKQAKKIGRVCEYCNSQVPDNEDKCPYCGNANFE